MVEDSFVAFLLSKYPKCVGTIKCGEIELTCPVYRKIIKKNEIFEKSFCSLDTTNNLKDPPSNKINIKLRKGGEDGLK